MARACLSLGSNVSPEANLRSAIAALRARFGPLLLSRVYRTGAVGFDGADFLNAAAVVETVMDPLALDAWLHGLEDAHGRDRAAPRFGDRTLDIDLVLYDDLVLEGPGHLRLPRDELRHAFVLRPLAEIAPGMVEPRSGRTLAQLWAESPERDAPMVEVEGFGAD
ncbi:2-amino-4-hydroxy-6-hydroxymethyldihydropteridine diphosphokinase [Luteimonas vadosa]|uniref:2-amino-4-hydroxy-6-hydroxymethyldihydropteridine pyrophosphokinase n=1 Tax=Luteimonas vadosa TaxID=1165507 RepID=A0ABP9DRT3_9GAMM